MEPALDTATAAAGGVVLRVKRRRDAQAPEQIGMREVGLRTHAAALCVTVATLPTYRAVAVVAVLEATSRVAALASDFGRSMGIAATAPEPAVEDVGTAPPKKRCRFVLLKAAAVTQPQVSKTAHWQQASGLLSKPYTLRAKLAPQSFVLPVVKHTVLCSKCMLRCWLLAM